METPVIDSEVDPPEYEQSVFKKDQVRTVIEIS